MQQIKLQMGILMLEPISKQEMIGDLSNAFDLMAQKLQESLIEIKEKEESSNNKKKYLLKFSQHEENDCVGVIDMADSTKSHQNCLIKIFSKMYEIFFKFYGKNHSRT